MARASRFARQRWSGAPGHRRDHRHATGGTIGPQGMPSSPPVPGAPRRRPGTPCPVRRDRRLPVRSAAMPARPSRPLRAPPRRPLLLAACGRRLPSRPSTRRRLPRRRPEAGRLSGPRGPPARRVSDGAPPTTWTPGAAARTRRSARWPRAASTRSGSQAPPGSRRRQRADRRGVPTPRGWTRTDARVLRGGRRGEARRTEKPVHLRHHRGRHGRRRRLDVLGSTATGQTMVAWPGDGAGVGLRPAAPRTWATRGWRRGPGGASTGAAERPRSRLLESPP